MTPTRIEKKSFSLRTGTQRRSHAMKGERRGAPCMRSVDMSRLPHLKS
jgi:hypothetical protein